MRKRHRPIARVVVIDDTDFAVGELFEDEGIVINTARNADAKFLDALKVFEHIVDVNCGVAVKFVVQEEDVGGFVSAALLLLDIHYVADVLNENYRRRAVGIYGIFHDVAADVVDVGIYRAQRPQRIPDKEFELLAAQLFSLAELHTGRGIVTVTRFGIYVGLAEDVDAAIGNLQISLHSNPCVGKHFIQPSPPLRHIRRHVSEEHLEFPLVKVH